MTAEQPFYLWSLAEAWDWLVNLPVLGFVALLFLAVVVVLFWVGLLVLTQD